MATNSMLDYVVTRFVSEKTDKSIKEIQRVYEIVNPELTAEQTAKIVEAIKLISSVIIEQVHFEVDNEIKK